MSEEELADRLSQSNHCELPVVDQSSGRLLGVISNRLQSEDRIA